MDAEHISDSWFMWSNSYVYRGYGSYWFEVDDVSALDVYCYTGDFISASSAYEKTSERITYDYQWRMDQPDIGYLLWSGVGSCVFYIIRDWKWICIRRKKYVDFN